MGQEAWDILRREVYAENDFHCVACGVQKYQAKGHKWLEAHEYYDIDYMTGRVTIKKIVALCHYCHNFIHSGRLQMIMGKEKSREQVIEILEHGFAILDENWLEAFYGTVDFALKIGANTFGVQESDRYTTVEIAWGDWRLIYDDKEYVPLFKDIEEWREHYAQKG